MWLNGEHAYIALHTVLIFFVIFAPEHIFWELIGIDLVRWL